ncbi:Sua5/YciO/YrdC/YwlC family protein [uncultured Croceitalea sp.]|uniref:L-threonylcarbamoyladenylate synthase n=1 Tax=uncultured Croceitalea sp. TaxID=1798908 RepID=UPI003305DAAB
MLTSGGTMLFPTDTGWCIGCDATNDLAILKALAFNDCSESAFLTCLVANQAMLERHIAKVPDVAYDIMDLSIKPTTLVLDHPVRFAKSLIDNYSIGIRVASDKFCQYLINRFKRPVLAIPVHPIDKPHPINIKEISNEILKSVDYVVNLQLEKENTSLSSIIKLSNDGTVQVIRE